MHHNLYRENASKTPAELLKIFRYPAQSQRELARAAEVITDGCVERFVIFYMSSDSKSDFLPLDLRAHP